MSRWIAIGCGVAVMVSCPAMGESTDCPAAEHRALVKSYVPSGLLKSTLEKAGARNVAIAPVGGAGSLWRVVEAGNQSVEVLIQKLERLDISLEKARQYAGAEDQIYQALAATRVERDFMVSARAVPNDPGFTKQWALHNDSKPHADIDILGAWERTTGSSDVVVAVLDSGIAVRHPDLAGNVWDAAVDFDLPVGAPGKKCPRGSVGYDAIKKECQDESQMQDPFGHGTHVAGIIGARGGNGLAVTGVNWSVRLLPIRMLDEHGSGYISWAIDGLAFVRTVASDPLLASKIKVTSNSWAYYAKGAEQCNSTALREAIDMLRQQDILFVGTADNESIDIDMPENTIYPAGFHLENMIVVGGSSSEDTAFGSCGNHTIDLAAPAEDIDSLEADFAHGGLIRQLSGTSMSTAFVSGVLALMQSVCPDTNGVQLKTALMSGVDTIPGLVNATQGRLNANQALHRLELLCR